MRERWLRPTLDAKSKAQAVTVTLAMREERARVLEDLRHDVNRAIICVPKEDLIEIMIDHLSRIDGGWR